MVCTLCCYPLWTAYADTDYRNKTPLVSIYFPIAGFRNQENESLAQSFQTASWVYFEFRKKRIWLERYATNHEPCCWTNGSVFFFPFYAEIVSLAHQLGCACAIPSRQKDPSSPGIMDTAVR